MSPLQPRTFKDHLYAQFARLGHAVSTPKRLELLDLLNQGETAVEQLAELSATPVKNTSARGPYCVYAVEAVELLRGRGYRARRLTEGVPGWRARGFPVAQRRAETPPPAPGHRRA